MSGKTKTGIEQLYEEISDFELDTKNQDEKAKNNPEMVFYDILDSF